MTAKVHATSLPLEGLVLVAPKVFADPRGFFLETFKREAWAAAGISCDFVQDNHSRSAKGIVRGMHFQTRPGQAKLVRVVRGRIFDVAVDIRPQSKTFGRWHGVELDDVEHRQLFIPVGFAHGFCVLSDVADVVYKVSSPYDAATESGFFWNDPDVGIAWPPEATLVSDRDAKAEPFAVLRARLKGGGA